MKFLTGSYNSFKYLILLEMQKTMFKILQFSEFNKTIAVDYGEFGEKNKK